MAIVFTTELKRFASQGEKTGWTYILIPQKTAASIKPETKSSFRVKGFIDEHPIHSVALIPMGKGDFILTVNAEMRKALRKQKGASVHVKIELDTSEYIICPGLLSCLEDDPDALQYFKSLLPSHQRYFSKWIESAKTDATITKRIAMAVNAMSRHWSFPEMLKAK
ncbi:MAG: YdeI/OmpD-associated family protein [Ferruginibacter sp.]